MASLFRLALAGLVLGAAGAAADEAKIDKDKIRGKWELVKTENKKGLPPGTTVEFQKDGGLKISVTVNKETISVSGTYTLDGDKLTINLEQGDKKQSETMTVTKLTDKQLVTKDQKGQLDTFKKK